MITEDERQRKLKENRDGISPPGRKRGRRGGEAGAELTSVHREVMEEEEEGGEGGHYWMTNTSIIAPPLPPRASGFGEEVMTLCPDTAKSHNGILPASAYTSLMMMMMIKMMMTSQGIQALSKQIHELIRSAVGSKLHICF